MKIKIKISRKDLKKIPGVLVEKFFLFFLSFFFFGLVVILLVVYSFSLSSKEKVKQEKVFRFESEKAQKIIQVFQEREEKFNRTGFEELPELLK